MLEHPLVPLLNSISISQDVRSSRVRIPFLGVLWCSLPASSISYEWIPIAVMNESQLLGFICFCAIQFKSMYHFFRVSAVHDKMEGHL